MAKRGIDISSHQGDIDLGAIADQIDFVIIRVGYGISGNIDNKFERNAELCEELGIPYGFYWYSYALNVDGAQAEADHFLNAITSFNPTMGCWFDMEDADGYKDRNGMPSNSVLQDMCYAFCEKVENAGYYAGIYASQSWFKHQLAGDKLNRFDKWIAQWPTRGGQQRGLDVSSEEKNNYSMWQFTSAGRFSGYRGNLDTNYAYHDFPNPQQSNQIPAPKSELSGSILELAARTMTGEFGDGNDRKNALGDRYDEVQNFIDHIFSASIDTLAEEVMSGKYGNGDTRKIVLGNKYDDVQNKVSEILHPAPKPQAITKGCKVKFLGTRSYSGIQLADWTHNDVFDVIEISDDRVVIGKGSAVTAAVNIRDCRRV